MGYKQISCSENLRIANDRYCDAQVDCATHMSNATCEVWPSMTGSYVAEVTRGLGGIMKCYIAGVQCFCNTLETVAEELCGKKYYRTLPQDPGDKEVNDAKADFCKTFKETFNPLFEKLETETDKVGQKHGKSTQAQVIGAYQKWWEVQVSKKAKEMIEYIPTFVDEHVKDILAEKKAKENEVANLGQSLFQELEEAKKAVVEEVKKELKETKEALIEEIKKELAALKESPKRGPAG